LARRQKLTVANLTDFAANKYGDKLCAIREESVRYEVYGREHDGKIHTYNEAHRAANVVAAAMRDKLGVKAGDRMALYLTNIPELGLFFTAAARLGAITVPFNYMLKAGELLEPIKDCDAKILVTEPQLFAANIKEKDKIPGIEHWLMTGPRDEVPEGFVSIDELAEGFVDAYVEPVDLDPDAPIAIFYTSGTTGIPKGATLTSKNLLSTVKLSTRILFLGEKDFGVSSLPLAHIFGFTTGIMGGFYSGTSGLLLRFFEPEKVLGEIEKNRATIILGVPAMYNLMLQAHPEKYDLSSMRYWVCGADAMPVDQIKQFESFGGKFIEGYGLVETSPVVSINPPFLRRPGSLGFPIPGVKVRIMDEDGKLLGRGKVGEIVVRGPNVMKGYWNDEKRTAEAFKYGWFHTGDIGYRDRLGYLFFVDREKDVIKVGGYSVFSCEVEEAILRNPKVHEVALVGAPDPAKGEVPVAFIQLKAGETAAEDELLEWCKENIASYRRPRQVKIIDDMPLTMTLKVMKKELRSRLAAEMAEQGKASTPE
jgi:long-chain acyl-CoA synthetase